MTYYPDDIMPFGVNKGYPIKIIHQFFPDYLSAVISDKKYNRHNFSIDENEFKKLPEPTPFFGHGGELIDEVGKFVKPFDDEAIFEIKKKRLNWTDPKGEVIQKHRMEKKLEYWNTTQLGSNSIEFAKCIVNKLISLNSPILNKFPKEAIEKLRFIQIAE